MIQFCTFYKACITISLVCSPNFLCSGVVLYPVNPDGARTCFFMKILATFPCTGNGQSTCSLVLNRACEDVLYTRWCMACFTPTAAKFVCCAHFVRVDVLPTTLFTPYLEKCRSPYRNYTDLASFQ